MPRYIYYDYMQFYLIGVYQQSGLHTHTHALQVRSSMYIYMQCVSVCFPVLGTPNICWKIAGKGRIECVVCIRIYMDSLAQSLYLILSASSQLICPHLANIIHPTRAVLQPSIVILEKITYRSIWHVHKSLRKNSLLIDSPAVPHSILFSLFRMVIDYCIT